MSHRIEDLDAMIEVAHNRWQAACVAEDTVLAARPDDDTADDRRYAYARTLVLVARHRETAWGEYERIAKLRQRTTTAC
jgi:hypothetical protein